jgi:hypothetical protein
MITEVSFTTLRTYSKMHKTIYKGDLLGNITVHLRVVGIQFQTSVTIDKTDPKIVDVLEAARNNGSGFNYVVAPDGTLHQASALRPAGQSISSKRTFPAGLYVLSDGVAGDNSITTWQWYLLRKTTSGFVQQNVPNSHAEPFSKESPILQDGDQIIWRLVVVALRPRIDASQKSYENKQSRLPVKSM